MRIYCIGFLFMLAGSALQAQSDPLDVALSRPNSGSTGRVSLADQPDPALQTMILFEGKFEQHLLGARFAMREAVESTVFSSSPEASVFEKEDLGDLAHIALATSRMNFPGGSREKKTKSKFRAALRTNILSRHKELSFSSRLRPGASRTSKGRPVVRSTTLSSNSEDGDGGDGPDPARTVSGIAEQGAPFSENRRHGSISGVTNGSDDARSIPRSIPCTT